jgi:hypothetical protein
MTFKVATVQDKWECDMLIDLVWRELNALRKIDRESGLSDFEQNKFYRLTALISRLDTARDKEGWL